MWGEQASVSVISLYQPTMGLIYVVEYPTQATKYKYIEIVLAQFRKEGHKIALNSIGCKVCN